jgi:CBS domain-containing protein
MVRRLMPDVVHDQKLAELSGTATVREAARLMAARNIGSVLVTAREGQLEGILTERDILCRIVAPGRDPDHTQLHEVMTKDPDTIGPSEPTIEALRRMWDGGYRHLPVVDGGGRPMGIVSHRDFLGEETTRLEDETRLWEIMG